MIHETKEKYEMIEVSDLAEINISTSGKYLITENKIRNDNRILIIAVIIGGIIFVGGIGVYIGLKKQYWLW